MKCGVVDVACVASIETTDSHGERVAERYVARCTQTVTEIAAVLDTIKRGLNPPAQLSGRGIHSHILQKAAETACAVQRSLRAAQDLDASKIARIQIRYLFAVRGG